MRPPMAGGRTAGERYARLRLEQMVRAGLLKQMPMQPPVGGYSAIWRAVSQGLNERVRPMGFTGALQALRTVPTDAQHQQAVYDPVSANLIAQAQLQQRAAASPVPDLAQTAARAAHRAAVRKAKRAFAGISAYLP